MQHGPCIYQVIHLLRNLYERLVQDCMLLGGIAPLTGTKYNRSGAAHPHSLIAMQVAVSKLRLVRAPDRGRQFQAVLKIHEFL